MADDPAPGRLGDDTAAQSGDPAPSSPPVAPTMRWEYLGVGCFSAFVGLAGGGMIAVLVAKIIGAVSRCPADAETGAPCYWFTYAVFGALIGLVLVPTISIWFFKRGRDRAINPRG